MIYVTGFYKLSEPLVISFTTEDQWTKDLYWTIKSRGFDFDKIEDQ